MGRDNVNIDWNLHALPCVPATLDMDDHRLMSCCICTICYCKSLKYSGNNKIAIIALGQYALL